MDILLAEITADAPVTFPWSAAPVLTLAARHRLSDEEPGADEDDDDDDWDDDDDDLDDDWDDDDLDDDWDEDDEDDDWDDDDDEDEPENRVTVTMFPAAARS